MPTRPYQHQAHGRPPQREDRAYDKRRGSARERGYTTRWDKARKRHLEREPLCRMCKTLGHVTAATVVDHIKPHRGDQALFWDTDNWQSLCKPHHDGTKQREEHGRGPQNIGADGWPL